ncbi:MAG: protein kinase domain-containing protein [Acidobacteriota bacterium]
MSVMLTCAGCGAPCRASDRFCSQCGRRDPAAAPSSEPAGDSGSWLADTTGNTQVVVGGGLEELLAPGTTFARRYRIERMLGEGGMGRVYKALDTTIDEPIALKFVAGAFRFDRAYLEQFKRELKLARRIRHRNVVASFHLGEAEGRAYITQEYIDADSLSVLLSRRAVLDEAECLQIIRQILRGLRAAHDLGIVHRDIKPGNILVNKDGVAFITDFGLALSGTYDTGQTVAGTPHYMAPELFTGAAATASSDLYACGILLFRALTGTMPFDGRGWDELRHAHQRQLPQPLPNDPAVSEPTRQLYFHLVAKSPADRPQRATDVLDVIDSVLATQVLTVDTERPIALVADADEQMRLAARERLEIEGYHVEAAATAEDIINLAFSLTPSLVVLDSNVEGGREIAIAREATTAIIAEMLPQHGALALCRLLQHDSRLQRVPILVMSERRHPALESAFRLMGAAEVIPKPFSKEEFASGLSRARQTANARAEQR